MRVRKTKMTMKLPNVGDRINRLMMRGNFAQAEHFISEPCEVTYVNRAHGWYEVRFLNSGLRECYSIPDFDHDILTNIPGWATPVVCVETGYVYPTISSCGKDLGLCAANIARCATGEYESYRGYHFDTVL